MIIFIDICMEKRQILMKQIKCKLRLKKTGFSDAYTVVVKDGKSSKVNDIVKQ